LKFIIDKGGRKGASGSATSGTTTIYTCPINKVSYILSLNLYWRRTTVAGTAETVKMLINSDTILNMVSTSIVEDHDSVALAFPIPIKLISGETIKVDSGGAETSVLGACIVYEISKFDDENYQKIAY